MDMPNQFKLVAVGKNSAGEEVQVTFPVINNLTVEQGYDGFNITGGLSNQFITSKSLTVSFNAPSMEISKLTGKENTMSFDYDLIAVRFPMNGQGMYDENSKLYFYLIKQPCGIQIGDFIYASYGITHRGESLNEVTKPASLSYYNKSLRVEAVWHNVSVNTVSEILKSRDKDYIIEFSKYRIKDRFFTEEFVNDVAIYLDRKSYDKIGYYVGDVEEGDEATNFGELLEIYDAAYKNKPKSKTLVDEINEGIAEIEKSEISESPLICFENGRLFKVNENSKEEKSMDMKKLMGDFVFGKLDSNEVKYSFNGIAFKTLDGTYNVYNEDGTLTNVSDMVLDVPVFAMPVSKAQLAVGDVILHPADRFKTPLIVKENAETAIIAVEPKSNEIKTFAPKKSIFGFDFYTKVVSPMDMCGGIKADADNPFGNMLPFLMMGDGETDMSTMLMLSMMNKDNDNGFDMKAMLPFLLMKDGKNEDMLMLMALGGFNFGK